MGYDSCISGVWLIYFVPDSSTYRKARQISIWPFVSDCVEVKGDLGISQSRFSKWASIRLATSWVFDLDLQQCPGIPY